MVRFYKGVAQHLLMCVDHLITHGASIKDLRTRIGRRQEEISSSPATGTNGRLYRAYTDYFNGFGGDQVPTTHDILDTILDQLEHERNKEDRDGTGDLIDFIVNTLQLPYARNVLGGGTLAALKKGILLPKELGGSRLVLQRELTCPGCNHTFQTGESCSIHRSQGEVVVYCTKCVKPSLMRCERCDEGIMPMNPGAFNKAMKEGCGCNGEGKKKEKKAPSPYDSPLEVLQDRDRGSTRASRPFASCFRPRDEEGRPFTVRPRGTPIIYDGPPRGGMAMPEPPPPTDGPQATAAAAQSLWNLSTSEQLDELQRRREADEVYERLRGRIIATPTQEPDGALTAAGMDRPDDAHPPEPEPLNLPPSTPDEIMEWARNLTPRREGQ